MAHRCCYNQCFLQTKLIKMKKIIIKTDKHCGFLRTEAVSKAIEYEETLMKDRKEGIYNCALWIKKGTQREYRFVVYHTKTAIVVDVRVV